MTEAETRDSPYLEEEHVLLRDQVRRFVEAEVMPVAERWERDGFVPREVFRHMGGLGFLGIRHPAQYGGSELDAIASVVFAEELARSSFGGFAASVLVHTDMASPHLVRYGSDAQKAKYLPGIISGEIVTAVAVTEPAAGSDVAGLKTRAVADGTGWVLNGTKMFITNGVYGDVVFVAARTDREAKGSRGISMFIVERDTPGFSVGAKLDKTGWRSSDTAELVFEDCRLPADALLGPENRGFYAIMDNFQNERLVLSAMATGGAERAIEITLEWLRQRMAFGATLWSKDTIRQRMAALSAKVAAARQLMYHAAWLDAQGRDCVREVSMSKAFSAEVMTAVAYDCVQFHGGMGYMTESPIERIARDSRVLPIGGGATEVMLEEVAKRM